MMAMMTPNNPMALPKISMIKTFNRYKTSLLANVQYPLFIKWGVLYGRKGIWNFSLSVEKYRKIPKISPGDYIFQRPFFEGLIFGGAYLRREICVSESGNLPFLLFLSLYSIIWKRGYSNLWQSAHNRAQSLIWCLPYMLSPAEPRNYFADMQNIASLKPFKLLRK